MCIMSRDKKTNVRRLTFVECLGKVGDVQMGGRSWLEHCPRPKHRGFRPEIELTTTTRGRPGTGNIQLGSGTTIYRQGSGITKVYSWGSGTGNIQSGIWHHKNIQSGIWHHKNIQLEIWRHKYIQSGIWHHKNIQLGIWQHTITVGDLASQGSGITKIYM